MNNLDKLLRELETKIPLGEILNNEISQTNVAWHVEHSLLILNAVTGSLIKSNPKDYQWKFNFIRMVVLTMKKIPRGRAKSPEVVQPKENVNSISLLKHLVETRNKITALDIISKDKYFQHPFFAKLKLQQATNFLEIHTKHHLNIIKDIINTFCKF
jgi:hypothetical protein